MKRAVLLLGWVACMVNATASFAQIGAEQREMKYLRVPHRFQIFVEGAIAMPTEPGLFNDFWNTAFQFSIGAGMVIFPWLEVNGTYSSSSFNNNDIASKEKLEFQGVADVEGGTIYTKMYYGSARFVAVPKARTNPFIEVGVGGFKTKADDLVIEGVLQNAMGVGNLLPYYERGEFPEGRTVTGICVVPSVGIQYSMNERWSAYTKYTYAINLNKDFTPGDLLLPVGETTLSIGDDQRISSINVGLLAKF